MNINNNKKIPAEITTQMLVKRIRTLKNICLYTGIIMIVTSYILKNSWEESLNKETVALNYNPYSQSIQDRLQDKNYYRLSAIENRFDAYSLYLSIFNSALAFVLYAFVSRYDKMVWSIFIVLPMFVIPNIALIIAGLSLPLKREYKELLSQT